MLHLHIPDTQTISVPKQMLPAALSAASSWQETQINIFFQKMYLTVHLTKGQILVYRNDLSK